MHARGLSDGNSEGPVSASTYDLTKVENFQFVEPYVVLIDRGEGTADVESTYSSLIHDQNRETNMCDCGKTKTSEYDFKKGIARKAAVLVASLPDERACGAMVDRDAARFLSAIRNFTAECTLAHSWNANDIASYGRALELVEATFEFAAPKSPTRTCGEEKNLCVEKCDIKDGGYFCYFDCRLEYVTCLAGTVLKASRNP